MATFNFPYNIYKAQLNEHPYSWDMLAELNKFGIKGLLHPDPLPNPAADLKRQQKNSNDFAAFQPTGYVSPATPITEFDFSHDGTYSIYNWEIFFHTVSLMGRQLRLHNKHAEAIRWLSYIFDPTAREESPPLLDLRFWQIKPFLINVTQGSIQNMLRLLSTANNNLTQAEIQAKADFEAQIAAWRRNPFDQHVIAAMRPRAYMLWTVMEYVTTLTDWGDYLFRQDTMESINEAINLYVMAQEILGPRPKEIERPTPTPVSFHQIMNNLSSFSNVLVNFENRMTSMNLGVCVQGGIQNGRGLSCAGSGSGSNTIPDLLFCVPNNPNMVAMWDRVEDRLFKIRHCLNIDGIKRQIALFSAPIDPALLVQAAAGGLSIADALADLATPLPNYRFVYLVQKANEFCNEVKGLGSQLLSLLEKKDAEELALFRQVHEQNILKAARNLKVMAIDEAKQNKKTLESSKNLIQIRLDDYSNREYKNSRENKAMEMTKIAQDIMYAEAGLKLTASILALIPKLKIGTHAQAAASGFSFNVDLVDGNKLGAIANYVSQAVSLSTSILHNKASQSLTIASYDRRLEEWNLQIKMATEELSQVDRQLLGADIRIAVTEKELENHDLQVEQSKEMSDFLKNKYTNEKLYQWMIGQIKTVYKTAFDLAFNMAKKAQVCFDYELAPATPTNVIQYGQWDGTKSGLLAGDRLAVQLKQLENRYIDTNERELELTKNISLALLDPVSLEELRAKGVCMFEIPDVLFNLDYPGHYFRRIKSVSISIPCVAGTRTNINATLSLTRHKIRTLSTDTSAIITTSLESIPIESIATSSAQNDSGIFELNLKDERYLPFEGRGTASRWTLELNDAKKQFDYNTISDVVIHMKYTARNAGSISALATANTSGPTGIAAMVNAMKQGWGLSGTNFHYAFSLRHDMPNEFFEFKQSGTTDVNMLTSRLPYAIQMLNITGVELVFIAITDYVTPQNPRTIMFKPTPSATPVQVTMGLESGTKTYRQSGITGASFGTAFTITEDTAGTALLKANIVDFVIAAKLQLA